MLFSSYSFLFFFLPATLAGFARSNWIRDADRDDPQKEAYLLQLQRHSWAGYRCPPMAQMSFCAKIGECLWQRGIPCVVVIPPDS